MRPGVSGAFDGSHRATTATVATAVLAVGGTAAITVALLTQRHAPQPQLSTPTISTTVGPATTFPTADPTDSAPKTVGPVLSTSIPLAIAIPAINVQSALLKLGRTASGALAVPPQGPAYNHAGWYEYSPTPGALGPAVIAGHVDSAADGPSVFFRLGALKAGDTIRITRTDRKVAVFTVNAVLRFHKTQFPTQLVYGNTNHAALRLITCGGPFDTATGHYLDNIVVLASLHAAIAPSRPGKDN